VTVPGYTASYVRHHEGWIALNAAQIIHYNSGAAYTGFHNVHSDYFR
jgi:hypothetical protein